MALATAAVTAATAASVAYLDAKFHLRKDFEYIQNQKRISKAVAAAAKQRRLSIYYQFEEAAKARGSDDCLWSRMGCYSWEEAYRHVNQYAQFFISQGVRPGDFVALFMRNTPDFPLAWMGLLAIGAAPALINCSLKGEPLVHCMDIASARVVMVDGEAELLEKIMEVKDHLAAKDPVVVDLGQLRPHIYALEPTRPPDEMRSNVMATSPMMLFYTSGTTGMPKACPLPMGGGFANGVGAKPLMGQYPNRTAADRSYNCMPFYHGTGGITMMAQLSGGITVCIGRKFSVSGFWNDIRDSRATWFVYVGETLRYLVASPPAPRDREHHVHTAYGNGLRPDVWHKFKERFGIDTIWEIFAMTEGVFFLANPCRGDFSASSVGHHGLLLRNKYQDAYVPVAIDSESGDIQRDPKTGFAMRVPYEESGEILVKIPGERSFPGYWNNPTATDKKYLRNVFEQGDCYFRTGDALKRDGDGRWFFMDRLGDTFRWKGENVSTAEVAEILGHFPGVVEVAVYGIALPGHDGKAGAAAVYVSPDVRGEFDYRGFLRHARSQLPPYAVPIFLRRLKASIATHNNKLNKSPLQKQGVDPENVQGDDQILWIENKAKGDTYVPFTPKDWADLTVGTAKL